MTKCTEALREQLAQVIEGLGCIVFATDEEPLKDREVLAKSVVLTVIRQAPLDAPCDAEKAALVEALDLELEAVESSINNLEQCPSDHHCNDVTRVHDRLLRQRDDLNRVSADTSPAAALLAQGERLKEWAPILEAAQRQDIKWKKPMPDIDFGNEAIYVWALKAQEEMGELSAALLGGLIGKEGRGDILEECYQLIAVLLRIAHAALAPEEAHTG